MRTTPGGVRFGSNVVAVHTHAHTHSHTHSLSLTHTHTHTHTQNRYEVGSLSFFRDVQLIGIDIK